MTMLTSLTNDGATQSVARRGWSDGSPTPRSDGPVARRVTLVATSPNQRGGTERVVYLLAGALRRRGVRAGVLVPISDEEPDVAQATCDAYVADGIPTRTDPRFSRRHVGFHNIRALRSLFRPGTVGTVNIHYSTTTATSLTDVLAVRMAGKRCVLSLHHPVPLAETSPKKRQAIATALRLANEVVVTTEYTRQQLLSDLTAPPRITVIPLGIPITPPAADPDAARAAARRELRLPANAFVIGHLARLVRYKGLFHTIKAIASLSQSPGTRPLHLLVAGDGPDREALEALGRRLLGNRVTFVGDIPDPDILYAASDLFVMPSSLEGFGLVYIEAALHGVPSIATPAGGVPYVIRDGQTGLLVGQEPKAIAAAIHRLRSDPTLLQSMGKRASEEARIRFSDAAMAAAYQKILLR